MTTIVDFGSMDHLPKINADKTIDATGKWFYLWCDSHHTHIVCG
jgi:imidazolonepropionase